MGKSNGDCSHLAAAMHRQHAVRPTAEGCVECLQSGSDWVHLRLCLSCGHVGCCDSSPNRHATKHFHATQHPVIHSFEPGERWAWCYVDQATLDDLAPLGAEEPPRHFASPA